MKSSSKIQKRKYLLFSLVLRASQSRYSTVNSNRIQRVNSDSFLVQIFVVDKLKSKGL